MDNHRVSGHADLHQEARVRGAPALRPVPIRRPRRADVDQFQLSQASMLAPTAETFRQFLEQQDFFVFVITIYVGAGLIANDRRRTRCRSACRSRSCARNTSREAAVLFRFLLLVTFVPAMLLLMLKVIFGSNFTFLKNNLFLVPAITTASLLQVSLAAFTILALSSLSKAPATSASSTSASRSPPRSTARSMHHGQQPVSGFHRRQRVAGGRRHLPAETALRDAVGGLAARRLSPSWSSRSPSERRVRGVEVAT